MRSHSYLPVVAVLLLLIIAGSAAFVDAVCAPAVSSATTAITVGNAAIYSMHFHAPSSVAYVVTLDTLDQFDFTSSVTLTATNRASGFATQGAALMKADATIMYIPLSTHQITQITLSAAFPKVPIVGTGSAGCVAADGTGASLYLPQGAAWTDATESKMHIPMAGCNQVAHIGDAPLRKVTYVVGDGSNAALDGFGTSARTSTPRAIAVWKSKFYITATSSPLSIALVNPNNNYQVNHITNMGSPQSTASNILFDGTYTSSGFGDGFASVHTSHECWLVVQQYNTALAHIVDPDVGRMFLVTGLPATTNWMTTDPAGNVWVATVSLAKIFRYSMAYTDCANTGRTAAICARPAMASRSVTQTITLPPTPAPVPPTPLPPGATFAPGTPVPATPVPATPVPATPTPATAVPPTPLPPGATFAPATPVPATAVPPTPLPPGATFAPATPTPATAVPPTPLPPGATFAPATPTPATAVPPTPLPPGATFAPATPTPATAVPPTPLPPGATFAPVTPAPPTPLPPGATFAPTTAATTASTSNAADSSSGASPFASNSSGAVANVFSFATAIVTAFCISAMLF